MLDAPWSELKAIYPDSFSYLQVAARGPVRLFDERPIVYPSFLWLMLRNVRLALVVQTVAYAGSFLALGLTAMRSLSSRLAAAAMVVLAVAVAIAPPFTLWNAQILTESLGITLAVASTAAWWSFCSRPRSSAVMWAWTWTLLWLGIRDSVTVPMLTVIVPAVVVGTLLWREIDPGIRRRLLGGAVLAVVLCGEIYVAQNVSQRTQASVHNTIGLRVLPDPALTRWFVAGGMPLDDALRGRTGHQTWDDGEAFLRAPELARYRQWAVGPGRMRLLSSLVLLAPTWYHRLVSDLPSLLDGTLQEYDSFNVQGRLPGRLPAPFGLPRSNTGLVVWIGVALMCLVVGAVASAKAKAPAAVVIFAFVGLLSVFVELYSSYAGDPGEVSRHLVGPFARLGLMLAVCVGVGLDGVVRLLRKRTTTRAAVMQADDGQVSSTATERG